MTEKVKVTKEQAEAIEELNNGVLAEMPFEDLAKAMIVGCEVEPEFSVGDWVKCNQFSGVYQVTKENQFDGIIELDNNGGGVHESHLRHATPSEIAAEKERRWWKEHGRDVWELKKGDLLTSDDDDYVEVFEGFGRRMPKMIFFKDGTKYEFSYIKEHYRIACFTENRLDVKTND